MSAKRQKTSGLSGVELFLTVKNLETLVAKSRKEVELNNKRRERALSGAGIEIPDEDEIELQELENFLSFLKAKLDGPQSYSFSSMAPEHLRKINVVNGGFINLTTDAVSHRLYRHICFLERFVPRKNEVAARLWINAFFYRAAFMLPEESMVLSVEQAVPAVTISDLSTHTLSGYINWTAVRADAATVKRFLKQPALQDLKNDDSALVVSEAKGPDQNLENHVPQAIGEMYGKTTIRGVVTNGRVWIFLILTLNKDGGGSYLQSQEITIMSLSQVSKDSVSVVSAIIAHWIMHSHKELDRDDYFTVEQ
ncbi:hypothetical protein NLJ89_g1664 [Agrocybe chaxingu]|uniref:Uncharacterized protein n=1 Tax=Agrocybe chaxingu TaxID=84603 RepID=A0A9W8MZL6_9AGAR|nr:hypothetical protein NLJ89_g1664 [Agrocybe chaxingu]